LNQKERESAFKKNKNNRQSIEKARGKKVLIRVEGKEPFVYVCKSHWVWDTFAEPNNITIPSVASEQNQASSRLGVPRPKSRLTEEGCD
jgi:hypothetical protein